MRCNLIEVVNLSGDEQKIFHKSRQRFKEYLVVKYPTLNKFKTCKPTDKNINQIIQYIPLDYINNILWHYMLFDAICQKPLDSKKYPSNEIKEIKRILKRLIRRNWLHSNNASEIESLILGKFLSSPEGIKYEQEKTKLRIVNRHGGRWPDYALNFLIFFLVEYMKEATGKSNYRLVESFINTQTDHKQINFIEIQKKYDRIKRNINRLWMLFNTLHHTYFKNYFDELFLYRDFSSKLNVYFIKFCLPEFIDFYPPKKKQFLVGNQT